jgi:hypothetical protein
MAGANSKVCLKEGGAEIVLGDGGVMTVEAGGAINIQAGASITRPGIEKQVGNPAKIGGTAGWVVGAADDLPYKATLPASKTGSTLVVPVDMLHVGDTITGFKVVAQIESAGGAATLDADLRAVTNVAADPTDASIGSITQVAVTEDTAVAAGKTDLMEIVSAAKSYYVLLTGTTAALTDIALLGLTVTVTEV